MIHFIGTAKKGISGSASLMLVDLTTTHRRGWLDKIPPAIEY
jgi:hypothetical protein